MRHTRFLTSVGLVGLLCMSYLHATAQSKPVPEQPDLRPYLLSKPRVLFTIRWGSAPGELPEPVEPGGDLYGPLRPRISADGSIYVGLRLFNRQGKLIKVLTLQTEPADPAYLRNPIYALVDTQGRILVYHYDLGREQLLMFGQDGKRLKGANALLQRAMQQARTLAATPAGPLMLGLGLKLLPDGRVIVGDGYRIDLTTGVVDKVPEQSGEPLVNLHRGYLYQVDIAERGVPRGKWYVYRAGEVHYTDTCWNEGMRLKVVVYDDKGRLLRQLSVPSGELSEVEKQVPFYTGLHAVDGRGHFYLARFPLVVYDIPLFAQDYQRYIAVTEYDQAGRFVGLRAVCEVFSSHNITVDKEGNVYWLQPGEEDVKVMMAPVRESTR